MKPRLHIRHDEARQRFEANVEGGVAHCDYQRRNEVLYLHHTEVPAESQGRGIAAAVVEAVLEYAERNSLKVTPRCSYVREYMRRHPQTQKLLPEGVSV